MSSSPAQRRSLGFFAPSGYLPDPAVMDRAAQYLAGRGWRISAGESVFAREQRFAGPDGLRAQELQRFATDKSLDVAVAARGGYGLSRLLEQLDYPAIAAARLPLVGYSDFTAFNLALLARSGAISFQGPSAADFSDQAESAFTLEHFFGAISQSPYAFDFAAIDADTSGTLEVRGRLWGGNLAMVCALLGTPFFPRVRGGILFLEDVNEPAYRIERMLLQLCQAGVLARQRAVLLGDFSSVPSLANDNGYGLEAVWRLLRARCATPLIAGLPFGHGRHRVTLAVGAQAHLRVQDGQARLQFQGHPTLRSR
ncbi:Murein tetrapeptide carboxypeptidase [Burkholderiales bacterium]|nr:Murein tetrapeptide carboxypeptidase [Burkholderiales bacterium]